MESRKRQRTESESNDTTSALPEGERLYFDSYSNLGIHEAMLRDTVRTETYYNAIMHHRAQFEGKVVVDVGCGTSILSIFCAWAGAKHVYAIEASRMADHARNVVAENKLQDTITIVQGKVEDVELIDVSGQPVVADVIISEWMGYFLYYESMLESVLLARDRWLSPNGVMFPSHAALYLVPLSDDQYYGDRVFFWQSVYGASMTSLYGHARKSAFDNVIIDTIQPYQCFAFPQMIKFIDTRTCTIEEVQNFQASFSFKSTIVTNFHGFVGYFTTLFTTQEEIMTVIGAQKAGVQTSMSNGHVEDVNVCSTPLTPASALLLAKLQKRDPIVASFYTLSTAPDEYPTHWQQALFFTGDQLLMVQDQELTGEIVVGQNSENRRFLDIRISWTIQPHEETPKWTAPFPQRFPRGVRGPFPARRGFVNPYAAGGALATPGAYPMLGAPGMAPQPVGCPGPDTENQVEEENPPLSACYAHSKVFGFK